MPTLFILSHAPHGDSLQDKTVSLAREGDSVLLIEDGVFAAVCAPTSLSAALEAAQQRGVEFYALEGDVAARGVKSSVPTVDYGGFVDLIAAHERSVH